MGEMPALISITQTAPPNAMEPSTVRSAKSRILNVIYTPRARTHHTIPWAMDPGNDFKSVIGSRDEKY
jgi:hypothetical protein